MSIWDPQNFDNDFLEEFRPECYCERLRLCGAFMCGMRASDGSVSQPRTLT